MGITTDKIMQRFAFKNGYIIIHKIGEIYVLKKNNETIKMYFDFKNGLYVNGVINTEYQANFIECLREVEDEYWGS